jgi:hypothetical protein
MLDRVIVCGVRQLVFLLLLLACTAFSLTRGGRPERVAGATMLIGCVLTWAVNSPLAVRYASVEVSIFMVDVVMLLIFAAVALISDRYWPIWVTALQLLVVLAHVARLADPDMLRSGYGFVMAVWSYPQLLAIAIGTWMNQQKRSLAALNT